jgi:hypothetical protein
MPAAWLRPLTTLAPASTAAVPIKPLRENMSASSMAVRAVRRA